jgi:hypothetical protein
MLLESVRTLRYSVRGQQLVHRLAYNGDVAAVSWLVGIGLT